MATQVLIAHTGQRLQIDAVQFASLDDFKASVSRQSSIPIQSIITLTPQGRPLKLQTIQTEKEIYVYDKRLTQVSSPGAAAPPKSDVPLPKRYHASTPPNSLHDDGVLQSWQDLFKTRKAWAFQVVEDCNHMANTVHDRYSEMDVMLRCLDAAVANLESVVKALEPKYGELKKWAPEAQADYSALTTGWEQYLSLARSIPISPVMLRFMTGRDVGAKGRIQRQATLEDLVDLDTARKAGRLAPAALRKFNARIADLDKVATRLFQDAEGLIREFEKTVARSSLSQDSEAEQLLQDIEALTKKIDTDFQTVSSYTDSTREVSQASKIAANHTEHLLPSIRKRAVEMDDMLRQATQARNSLAVGTIDFMRTITDVTALSHAVKSQMNGVNQEDELATFDYLRLIQQVPYMYASFVAEAVKRREWFDKVKQDSSTLANEMALFQDEEVKRRRRWQKSVGDAYGPENPSAESSVPGLEVNLFGEDDQWPSMVRTELGDFIELLQRQKADTELVADIAKLAAELNNPTRQQSRRLKAFKNGSVHEAALGRSGLLIRGDDDLLRSLQEERVKLESKLKTAESRVRRLEDLLHRQSQASRPSPGTIFQVSGQQLSDRNDSTISVKSTRAGDERRASLDGTEVLMHRIQQLEADLSAERERSAVFEKDLSARVTLHNDMKGQMEEANSTKKDLLENLEALKREFLEERKSLEDEVKRLQARLEDAEDEIEHFGESRENEKASHDEKLHALELEVERLAQEKHDEALKSEGQVEFLRKEARLQRERVEAQERQLQAAQDGAMGLTRNLEDLQEDAELQLKTLRELHEQLSPGEPAPEDLGDLVGTVSGRVADVTAKVQNTEGDLALLKSDIDRAHATIKGLRADVSGATEKLSNEELTSMHLREKLSEEKARVAALEAELGDGREHIDRLRTQLVDGESGSESLRNRLVEQEAKITTAMEDLASRQSQVGGLEEELRLFRERFEEAQARMAKLTLRLDTRTERAKDLTQRLYSQNERLGRLLERLGFSVTRQGESMVIQRIPRSERSPQNANDPDLGSSMRRSGTLNSHVTPDSAELELLYWMNNPEPEVESEKFEAYMSILGSFDVDAFSEMVYKRLKDVEHLARKLQRDARSYKEKAHALQKESHDKIAIKHFKEGDLALFLPTRNQTTGAWAAFNVGFPHYFLREQEAHRLRNREWLVARILRIQERVVDLSKSLQHQPGSGKKDAASGTMAESDSLAEEENDNPFDLSDGLRWYLIDAGEDKPGAPSTPGLAKTTVAANNVEAMADIHTHGRTAPKGSGRPGLASGIEGVSKTLSKSLESRRSSTGSKKALPFAIGAARSKDSALASETNSLRAAPADTPIATSPTQHPQPHPHPQAAAAQGMASKGPSTLGAEHGSVRANGASPGEQNGQPLQAPSSPEALTSKLVQREQSSSSVESPSMKSVVWDALWSLDLSYEGGRKRV